MMHYHFEIQPNGMIQPDVAGEEGVVHFDEPVRGDYGKVVPIRGDTYSFKDEIMECDWEETHRKWNGDYWQADLDTIREVINQICSFCDDVTVHKDVVEESESMAEFRGKFDIGYSGDETFEFISGPQEGDGRVSMSWAEDAAEVGNYSSVEEFAEEFDFEVVPDKELFDDYEDEHDVDEDGIIGSESMTTGD